MSSLDDDFDELDGDWTPTDEEIGLTPSERLCECSSCGTYFSGVRLFDWHRIVIDRTHPTNWVRGCREVATFPAVGLWATDEKYAPEPVWHGQPNKTGKQKRRRFA